jgi:hypothetical protein
LLTGSERLDERGSDRMLLGLRVGDRHDKVLGAWLAKESVRDVYLAEDYDAAAGCWTRRSPAVAPTTLPKSNPSATPSTRGVPRSSFTTPPARRTARPKV